MIQSIIAYVQANLVAVSVVTVGVAAIAGASLATANYINNIQADDAKTTVVDNRSDNNQSPVSIDPRYNAINCAQGEIFIGGVCR